MTDRVLENAEKRLDDLAKEINRHVAIVEELKRKYIAVQKWIEDWHEFAGDAQAALLNVSPSPAIAEVAPKQRTTGNPSKEAVAEMAKEIIAIKGHPMPRDALFAALEERGFHLKGSDPKMVLSTMLWRMPDEVIRFPKFGYWIKSEPYAPANYVPGDEGPDPDAAYEEMILSKEEDSKALERPPNFFS